MIAIATFWANLMASASLRETESRAILSRLSHEQRRVLSDWRAFVLLRRATLSLSPVERRWSELPATIEDVRPLLRRMVRQGDLAPIRNAIQLYLVTVPYANSLPPHEYEVLEESNPYAAISHYSALVFHGLTLTFPKTLYATSPRHLLQDVLPVGTRTSDWEGHDSRPKMRFPADVLGRDVEWTRAVQTRFFGDVEYEPYGYAVRIMSPERTLLDGLVSPQLCGGIATVLEAWGQAIRTINLELLFHYVERFDMAVLRQRVGFVLESLGIHHPEIDAWQTQAQRGGSSVLVASEPYSSRFDERWSLSLNGPIELLD